MSDLDGLRDLGDPLPAALALDSHTDVEWAILDLDGVIVQVNDAWVSFTTANGGDPGRCGVGTSYLAVCTAAGDPDSMAVAAAVRAALRGELPAPARVRLACDSPSTARWFDVLVSSRLQEGSNSACTGATVSFSPVDTAAAHRLGALLDAVAAISGDLDLSDTLQRIIQAAARLADAQYGALGVVTDGRLSQFVTVGISDEQRLLIGDLPQGKGLLGVLIDLPEPLHLDDLSAHAASSGFPPGHPPMRSFLGVPIRARQRVLGNLYLSEKRGGGGFTADDQELMVSLAVFAGVAIDNAHVLARTRRSQEWVAAAAQVSTALLSGAASVDVLALIAAQARALCEADLSTIAVAEAGDLVITVADGDEAALMLGRRLPIQGSLAGHAYGAGASLNIADARTDPRAAPPAPGQTTYGPTLVVPLRAGRIKHGVLTVHNAHHAHRFDAEAQTFVEIFADQAALALEIAEHDRARQQLKVHDDRDRIARDLHDLVIQSLFASGMRLEALSGTLTREDQVQRVQQIVDALDGTIRQIRSTIYALHASDHSSNSGLRARLLLVADAATETLGFSATVHFNGPVDTLASAQVGEHVVAVLQEGLSNVARHADARHASVTLTVTPAELALEVVDDGVGIRSDGRRSGLANMHDRARQLGGTLDVSSPGGVGTRLLWRVPL